MPGLRWRYFWSRRSRTRTAFALLLAFVGLLLAVYLVLPASGQALVMNGFGAAAQNFVALGTIPLVGIVVAACALASIALIFFPTYRSHTYLTTSPSIIPPISVYLDAENQLHDASAISSFMQTLMKHLNGQRADLLYFLDASATATGENYKELYRFGFRPIDVAHNPTGKQKIKEAVDKELAMHALERALLGPSKQEFIIVTGDQDFVHLVYRLVALGHHVQIWASPMRAAYRTLASYLDIDLLDLTQVVSELQAERQAGAVKKPQPTKNKHRPSSSRTPNSTVSSVLHSMGTTGSAVAGTEISQEVLALSGERTLQRIIEKTVEAYNRFGRRSGNLEARLRTELGGPMNTDLAQIGYVGNSKLDYWLEHLCAVRIFRREAGRGSLMRDSGSVDDAAGSLFRMVEASAQAVAAVAEMQTEGIVRMDQVATYLATADDQDVAVPATLRPLVQDTGMRRTVHARYFVRGARALGLIAFDDVPDSLDRIKFISLPGSAPAPDDTPVAMPASGDGSGSAPPLAHGSEIPNEGDMLGPATEGTSPI